MNNTKDVIIKIKVKKNRIMKNKKRAISGEENTEVVEINALVAKKKNCPQKNKDGNCVPTEVNQPTEIDIINQTDTIRINRADDDVQPIIIVLC